MDRAAVKWGEAIEICRELLADRAEFDRLERDYKTTIIDRIKTTFAAAELGDPIGDRGRAVFRPPNNLVNWRARQRFQRWVPANPTLAAPRSSGSPATAHRSRSASMATPTRCRPMSRRSRCSGCRWRRCS
jgi:hypothetical protein